MLSFTKIVQFGIEKSWKFKVKQTFGKKTVIAKLSQLVLYRAEISLFPSFSPPATGKVLPSLVECCSSAIILLGIISVICDMLSCLSHPPSHPPTRHPAGRIFLILAELFSSAKLSAPNAGDWKSSFSLGVASSQLPPSGYLASANLSPLCQ